MRRLEKAGFKGGSWKEEMERLRRESSNRESKADQERDFQQQKKKWEAESRKVDQLLNEANNPLHMRESYTGEDQNIIGEQMDEHGNALVGHDPNATDMKENSTNPFNQGEEGRSAEHAEMHTKTFAEAIAPELTLTLLESTQISYNDLREHSERRWQSREPLDQTELLIKLDQGPLRYVNDPKQAHPVVSRVISSSPTGPRGRMSPVEMKDICDTFEDIDIQVRSFEDIVWAGRDNLDWRPEVKTLGKDYMRDSSGMIDDEDDGEEGG